MQKYLSFRKHIYLAAAVFILYLIFFCWLITRVSFFKQSGLSSQWLISLFLLKIMAGAAYGFFYGLPTQIAGADTWRFFEESKIETDWLLHQPIAFIKDLFHYGYSQSSNLFSGKNSYWNDLKSNVIIKLMAVINVFTGKQYYTNLLFFNFLFFFGPVALYRLMTQLFLQKKIGLIVAVFLLPSFLFWCSGVHKDGLIFTCLALSVYYFNKQLSAGKISIKPLMICLASTVLLFALRNFVVLLLVPALLTWWMAHKFPAKSKLIILFVYGCATIVFFVSPFISSSVNMPQYIITKQAEFKQLSGASAIAVPALNDSPASFAKFLPTAVDIALLRPHVSEIKNKSYIPAAAEVIILNLIAVLVIVFAKKKKGNAQQSAYQIFCICFCFSFLLLAGYTITFSGAIVRYRAIVLPLLFSLLVQYFPWFKKNNL